LSTPIDHAAAHRFFAPHCFNQTWLLIEKTDRTEPEEREMLGRTLASLWHWRQRADHTPKNISVGCWQAARVCALLGLADLARRYAEESIENSPDDPFYRGYALEGLARAEAVAGNKDKAAQLVNDARALAQSVTEQDDRDALLADLATIMG